VAEKSGSAAAFVLALLVVLHNSPPSIVLLDLRLPILNGLELATAEESP
jgi:DNA-binding response OmpR family regulator